MLIHTTYFPWELRREDESEEEGDGMECMNDFGARLEEMLPGKQRGKRGRSPH